MAYSKEYAQISKQIKAAKKEFKDTVAKINTQTITKSKKERVQEFVLKTICDNRGIGAKKIHDMMPNTLHKHTNSNMISSWNITQPSCNNFNDGSVYPSIINNYPDTYLWSDGTIGDTLKNVSQGLYTLFITDTNNCVEYHQFQLNDPYVISFGNISHNNCIGDSIGTATVASSGCVCQFSTCTYLWDNGSLIKHATNLPSGMQHVIITLSLIHI